MTFFVQFQKVIMRYKCIGYNLIVIRQSACLVINPIMVDNFSALLRCTPLDRASDYDGPDLKLFILIALDRSFRLLLGAPELNLLTSFTSDYHWCCLAVYGPPVVLQQVLVFASSHCLTMIYL